LIVSFADGKIFAMKNKISISRPYYLNGEYIVEVKESNSPLAKIIADYKFKTMREAQKGYQFIMKEYGFWI